MTNELLKLALLPTGFPLSAIGRNVGTPNILAITRRSLLKTMNKPSLRKFYPTKEIRQAKLKGALEEMKKFAPKPSKIKGDA
jgi:hypothetical protein